MNCQDCKSERILELSAKCSDCCGYTLGNFSSDGYVPAGLGIGGGDYVEFNLCLDCGKIQGKFPRPLSDIEKDITDEEVGEFYDNAFVEGKRIAFLHTRAYDIKKWAKELCPKFGVWFEEFMNENNGSPKDYASGNEAPSVKRFIRMYRDNSVYIEE